MVGVENNVAHALKVRKIENKHAMFEENRKNKNQEVKQLYKPYYFIKMHVYEINVVLGAKRCYRKNTGQCTNAH